MVSEHQQDMMACFPHLTSTPLNDDDTPSVSVVTFQFFQHHHMVRKFIHWFILQLFILFQGQWADIGRGRGSPQTSRPLITGLTHRDEQRFTLTITPMGNLKSQINLEAGATAENPGWHEENMQTPHRKIKPQPSIEPRTLWILDELLAVRQQC